jgi:glycosyltransferase involved in cell wall biosynthesis
MARICFVAPSAYNLISGRLELTHIGGAEVQQLLVARALARRGYQVSFVSYDYGQPDGILHGGLLVWKSCRPGAGLPGLRFLHPRWTGLWSALARANADFYYKRCGSSEAGQVALWCRLHKRGFIFAAAVDGDCERSLPVLKTARERVLYRYGLRRADRIIAQTETQVELLRESFGLESVLIRSCTEEPPESERSGPGQYDRSVLWVGRIIEQKRPELLLDLAQGSPDLRFDLVGDCNLASGYARSIVERARKLPNVVVHGAVAREVLGGLYRRAALLLCTSSFEGFPNVFLEAWARGVPTVATLDPDGLIERNGLGAVGVGSGDLLSALKRFVDDPALRDACSRRARRFFLENHTVDLSAAGYHDLLQSLAMRSGRKAR